MSFRLARILSATSVAVLASVALVAAPAQADDQPAFYDGSTVYSDVTNCQSIVFPPSYSEKGAAAYVGQLADPDSALPVAGTGFEIRVFVYGLGNACGGQRFLPGFALAAGMSIDQSRPISCFATDVQVASATDCPQWGNVFSDFGGGTVSYRSTDTANSSLWPLPQGKSWEFRFPVTSSQTHSGTTLQGFVRMFDGNSSPTLTPTVPLYVFGGGAAPSVIYDSPSTTAVTQNPDASANGFGVLSRGTVTTANAAGAILFQKGTVPASMAQVATISVPAGPGWSVWTDWNDPGSGLVTGNHYYWRLGFDPGSVGGGDTVWGATQDFTYPLTAAPGVTGPGPQGPQGPPVVTPSVPVVTPLYCHGKLVTVNLANGQSPTAGDDVILGTEASDRIMGGAGNDTICGGAGNDVIEGGGGNDRMDGGAGVDTLSYSTASKKVGVSIASSKSQKTGGAGTDTASSFENLTGGKGGDKLTGNGKANTIHGGAGSDSINGGSGNDKLYGDAGNDTLSGGKGKDRGDGGKGRDTGSSIEVKKSL